MANIIAALQLCLDTNHMTTNIFAAMQLKASGRAALIFVEKIIEPQN